MKLFFERIWGSPLRFYGFFTFIQFIYTGLILFESFHLPYSMAPFCFLAVSSLLYLIAFLTKDLNRGISTFNGLLGSPVKCIAFIIIILGSATLLITVLWKHFSYPSLFVICGGVGLYLIDLLFAKKRVGVKIYWAVQGTTTLGVLGLIVMANLYANANTTIHFPKSAQNEAIVVYGIEGYPPLPQSYFWHKEIQIPESGLLITSSLINELPGYRRNYFDEHGDPLQLSKLFVQEVCEDNKVLLTAEYFTPRGYYPYVPFGQSELQIAYQELYEAVCNGSVKSAYTDTRLAKYRNATRAVLLERFLEHQRLAE